MVYPWYSLDEIKEAQKILSDAFGQDGYIVRRAKIICDIHNCTNGNKLRFKDGRMVKFRRFVDVRNKKVYWSFD